MPKISLYFLIFILSISIVSAMSINLPEIILTLNEDGTTTPNIPDIFVEYPSSVQVNEQFNVWMQLYPMLTKDCTFSITTPSRINYYKQPSLFSGWFLLWGISFNEVGRYDLVATCYGYDNEKYAKYFSMNVLCDATNASIVTTTMPIWAIPIKNDTYLLNVDYINSLNGFHIADANCSVAVNRTRSYVLPSSGYFENIIFNDGIYVLNFSCRKECYTPQQYTTKILVRNNTNNATNETNTTNMNILFLQNS